MKNITKTIFTAFTLILLSTSSTAAQTSGQPIPVVSNTTATSASVTIVPEALAGTDVSRGYFEYYETEQVCIMIYPTPENCKPKQTTLGSTSVLLTGLKPATQYTIAWKIPNTIACVTTPCPGNGYEGATTTFATTNMSTVFTRNMAIGARGTDVTALQVFLNSKGYLTVSPTGYYGVMTRAAVSMYQTKDMQIVATGTVGPLTRASLNAGAAVTEERFSGAITAVSLSCFADGICSVSVDGKEVVTTIGWSRDTVGSVKGVSDIGALEKMIGARVNVYAKKTDTGYTLYGNSNYYIEVVQ